LSSSCDGGKTQRFKSWTTSLPDKGNFSHLWDWLRELGLGHDISWQEVKAWADLTGSNPSPDEAQALVQLSRIWLTEFRRGTDKNALPPWMPEF